MDAADDEDGVAAREVAEVVGPDWSSLDGTADDTHRVVVRQRGRSRSEAADGAQRERACGGGRAAAEGDEHLEVVARLAEVEHRAGAEWLPVVPDRRKSKVRGPGCEWPLQVAIVE